MLNKSSFLFLLFVLLSCKTFHYNQFKQHQEIKSNAFFFNSLKGGETQQYLLSEVGIPQKKTRVENTNIWVYVSKTTESRLSPQAIEEQHSAPSFGMSGMVSNTNGATTTTLRPNPAFIYDLSTNISEETGYYIYFDKNNYVAKVIPFHFERTKISRENEYERLQIKKRKY